MQELSVGKAFGDSARVVGIVEEAFVSNLGRDPAAMLLEIVVELAGNPEVIGGPRVASGVDQGDAPQRRHAGGKK